LPNRSRNSTRSSIPIPQSGLRCVDAVTDS
jgi:hypothetical protein